MDFVAVRDSSPMLQAIVWTLETIYGFHVFECGHCKAIRFRSILQVLGDSPILTFSKKFDYTGIALREFQKSRMEAITAYCKKTTKLFFYYTGPKPRACVPRMSSRDNITKYIL